MLALISSAERTRSQVEPRQRSPGHASPPQVPIVTALVFCAGATGFPDSSEYVTVRHLRRSPLSRCYRLCGYRRDNTICLFPVLFRYR